MRFIPFIFSFVTGASIEREKIKTITLFGTRWGVEVQRFDAIVTQYLSEYFGDAGLKYLGSIKSETVQKFVLSETASALKDPIENEIKRQIGLVSRFATTGSSGENIFYDFHKTLGFLELVVISEPFWARSNTRDFLQRVALMAGDDNDAWTSQIRTLLNEWYGPDRNQSFRSSDIDVWKIASLHILARAHWADRNQANSNRDKLFELISDPNFSRITTICAKQRPFGAESCDGLKLMIKSVVEQINKRTIEALISSELSPIPDFSSIYTDTKQRLDFMYTGGGKLQTDLPLIVGSIQKLGQKDFASKIFSPIESISVCPASGKYADLMIKILSKSFTAAVTKSGFDRITANYPNSFDTDDAATFCTAEYPFAGTEGELSAVKRAVLCHNSVNRVSDSARTKELCSRMEIYFQRHLNDKLAILLAH